jgi:ribonuclease D
MLQDFSVECWKVAGATRIDPHQAAVLQSLCDYRDRQAQKADLPHFKILSNKVLLEVCLQMPKTVEDLTSITGLTEKNIQRHGQGLLHAIVDGENEKGLHRAPKTKPDEYFIERYEKLKDWRRNKAKELKVESDVVLPKDMLERISGHNPRTLDELAKVMTLSKVRFERYGTSIMKALLEEENS